jgi:hypothetical protein
MVRLDDYFHKPKYREVNLKLYSLLFLNTLYSSSIEADWNRFLIDFAQAALSVRSEVVDSLQAFNSIFTERQEDFANMKHRSPFKCLYKTKATAIVSFNHIVSATFAGNMKRIHY